MSQPSVPTRRRGFRASRIRKAAQCPEERSNRLDAASIGGATPPLDYVYEAWSNRLKQVTGTFKQGSTRNAGSPDNFAWTADGNLSVGNSKSKWVGYDAEGLPSYIGSGSTTAPGGDYVWPLYDADGQMVCSLSQVNRPEASGPTSRVHYVRLADAPQKEVHAMPSDGEGGDRETRRATLNRQDQVGRG